MRRLHMDGYGGSPTPTLHIRKFALNSFKKNNGGRAGMGGGETELFEHCRPKHDFIQWQIGLHCVFLGHVWVLICHMQLFNTMCYILYIGSCSCSQYNCGNSCSSLKPQEKKQLLAARTLRLEILPQNPAQLSCRLILSWKSFKDPLLSAQTHFNYNLFASLFNTS